MDVAFSDCIHTHFEDDDVSSTLHILIPDDLLPLVKEIPEGQVVKVKAALEYSEDEDSLYLTAQTIIFVSVVSVVVK